MPRCCAYMYAANKRICILAANVLGPNRNEFFMSWYVVLCQNSLSEYHFWMDRDKNLFEEWICRDKSSKPWFLTILHYISRILFIFPGIPGALGFPIVLCINYMNYWNSMTFPRHFCLFQDISRYYRSWFQNCGHPVLTTLMISFSPDISWSFIHFSTRGSNTKSIARYYHLLKLCRNWCDTYCFNYSSYILLL